MQTQKANGRAFDMFLSDEDEDDYLDDFDQKLALKSQRKLGDSTAPNNDAAVSRNKTLGVSTKITTTTISSACSEMPSPQLDFSAIKKYFVGVATVNLQQSLQRSTA